MQRLVQNSNLNESERHMALAIAFLSAILRSMLNIIDRKSFGLQRDKILPTLIINNLYPLLLLFVVAAWANELTEVVSYLFNSYLLLMGLLFQVTAYGFSLSFRHMKVQEVVVVSKLADVIIPLLIFLLMGSFNLIGYLGTLMTTAICFPLVRSSHRQNRDFLLPALFTLVAVSLQGGFSRILLPVTDNYLRDLVPITLVIIFWRLFFSLLIHFTPMVWKRSGSFDIHFNDFRFRPLQLLRSVITLLVQVSFVTAIYLAKDNFLIWPILNSTILFSIVFSGIMLKEQVEPRYYLVTALILLLVFVTAYIQSVNT